jgi:hypothetical protein
MIAEAKAQGAQIISAAEQEALRTGEVTRSRIGAEVEALEVRRQVLSADVDALSGHIATQRERLAATVDVLRQALEHPKGLQEAPRPALSDDALANPIAPATPEPSAPAPPAADTLSFGEPEPGTSAAGPTSPPFPAPRMAVPAEPITQEVPLVSEQEPQAWSSFFDSGPTGDDRWKR